MAEELRITLVDGGSPTPLATKTPAPAPGQPGAPPTELKTTKVDPAGKTPTGAPPEVTPGTPPPTPAETPGASGFDPAAEAAKITALIRETFAEVLAQVRAEPPWAQPVEEPPWALPADKPAPAADAGDSAAMSGAAAAAGPAAAAMAIAMMVKAKISESLAVAAQAGGRAAALDTGVLLDGMTKTLEQFGLLGTAVAGTVNALKQFSDGLSLTAKRLSAFSGPLAGAEAMANVAQVQGDIRRAQLLGPELADFVAARSRLEQRGQDALAQAIKPLIPIATKALEKLDQLMTLVGGAVDSIGKAFEEMPDWLKATIDMAAPLLGLALRYIAEIAKNTKKDAPQVDLLLDELLNLDQEQINNLFSPQQRQTTPVPTEAPVGGPVFGGI